jgi:hypothetical protein
VSEPGWYVRCGTRLLPVFDVFLVVAAAVAVLLVLVLVLVPC